MTSNGSPTFLTRATDALSRGLRVIPLRPRSKQPFMDDWTRVATRDGSVVSQWALAYPDANCGVVTDKEEAGTWILDVDSPLWFLDACPALPETLAVRTGGGGLQFHFRHDANSRAKLRNLAVPNPHKGEDGQKETLLEVLADAHQGVWAGSVHPSGKLYEVYRDLPVRQADPKLLDWLKSLVGQGGVNTNRTYFNALKPDWNPRVELASAGLRWEELEENGKVYFNYHGLMDKCLVKGSAHTPPNPRQSAFVWVPATNEFWHQCFSPGCKGHTREALKTLGLDLDSLLDKGMPVQEAVKAFRTRLTLDQRPLEFLVQGLVPSESLTALAGLSGHGKTWLSLSLAKALVKGGKLWGEWDVVKRTPVLYLVPEVGDRSLKLRLDILSQDGSGWCDHQDWFLSRTFTEGETLSLSSPEVLAVARGRVVFLDTTIRFVEGEENNATDNSKGLARAVLGLIAKGGATGVVLLHHSPKAFRNEQEMYLENVLRGTGDIGAMISAAYGVRLLDPAEAGVVHVECLKPRDFEGPRPFQLGLKPFLNELGDLAMVKKPGDAGALRDQKGKGGAPKKSTPEQRQLVLKLKAEGKSEHAIAQVVDLSRSSVRRIIEEEVM